MRVGFPAPRTPLLTGKRRGFALLVGLRESRPPPERHRRTSPVAPNRPGGTKAVPSAAG